MSSDLDHPAADTPLYQLLSLKLGRPLAEWINETRHAHDPPLGWRAVTEQLVAETDVPVTFTTLARWFKDDEGPE